ncbi:MAG: hypothetical protein ACLUTH_03605 [Blautia massiliensis (ex Durand et al. 2017)]
MDKRLACFPAEKHFVKIGSRTGFIENVEAQSSSRISRCIGRFGDERNGSSFVLIWLRSGALFLQKPSTWA